MNCKKNCNIEPVFYVKALGHISRTSALQVKFDLIYNT